MYDYFEKLNKGPIIKFIIVLSLIAFFIKIPTGMLGLWISIIFELDNPLFNAALQEPTLTPSDMILAIVVAPFLETIFGQFLPIELVRKITKNTTALVISSGFIFMLFHYPVLQFFPSAFAVGAILSWAWIAKRPSGKWNAFWIVTFIHSLHNTLAALFTALFF